MKRVARAAFEIRTWDEKPYSEPSAGSKLTRATVTKAYTGEIEGEGTVEYLMAYAPDGSASFVGLERFVGRVGDKRGTFVFQHAGTFQSGVARSVWSIVPGSGTGELEGLRGGVNSALGHEKSYPVELEYESA